MLIVKCLLLEALSWWPLPLEDVDVILKTNEHWQNWNQIYLYEFLLLSKNMLTPLKALVNEFYIPIILQTKWENGEGRG
jgi:hypothetical protein